MQYNEASSPKAKPGLSVSSLYKYDKRTKTSKLVCSQGFDERGFMVTCANQAQVNEAYQIWLERNLRRAA